MTPPPALALASLLLVPALGRAAVTISINQVGADVVATASGSITSLSGLTAGSSYVTPDSAVLAGWAANINMGPAQNSGNPVTSYTGFSATPANFGYSESPFAIPTSSTGSFLFTLYFGTLQLSQSYVLGTAFDQTATWTNQSISSLKLAPGTYTYAWAGDAIDIVVNATPVPEPSTYGLALGGLALALVAARRSGRRSAARR